MDSSLNGVDYEVISGDPFWLVTHLNRTTLSALFYSQWSESCCIYHWPAINASSGRLVITNGSRSTEPPLWSRRHWREVYLVGRIDQHVVFFLDLFIYLRSVQREERGQSISTQRLSPLEYLPMIGWRRCAVPDVRLFRTICGKLLCSNWALKMNRAKHFHHRFWFSVQDEQKEVRTRTNIMLGIEAPLNKGSLCGTHLEVCDYKLSSSLYNCSDVPCVIDGTEKKRKKKSLLHSTKLTLSYNPRKQV